MEISHSVQSEAVRSQEGKAPLLYVAWTSHNPAIRLSSLYQHFYVHRNKEIEVHQQS